MANEQPQAAQQGRRTEHAGTKLVVGCCLPLGLRLRADKLVGQREVTLGGYRDIEMSNGRSKPDIFVRGNAFKFGEIPSWKIVGGVNGRGGFGITEGVDGEHWDTWLAANKNSDIVVNELIFAEPSLDRAIDHAKSLTGKVSNFEPLLRDNDPRTPKRTPNLQEIGEEAERKAKSAA